MKTIFIAALLIPTFVLAQDYDRHSCMAEQILKDCKEKDIMLPLDNNEWRPLSKDERNLETLKQHIVSKEEEYKQEYSNVAMPSHFDFALYCQKQDSYEKTGIHNTLSYNENRFLWLGSPIDCAVKQYSENSIIKFKPSISFFSWAPFSINFFPITIVGGMAILFFINRKHQFIQINTNKKSGKNKIHHLTQDIRFATK